MEDQCRRSLRRNSTQFNKKRKMLDRSKKGVEGRREKKGILSTGWLFVFFFFGGGVFFCLGGVVVGVCSCCGAGEPREPPRERVRDACEKKHVKNRPRSRTVKKSGTRKIGNSSGKCAPKVPEQKRRNDTNGRGGRHGFKGTGRNNRPTN